MADRRMFAKSIVLSDVFLDMPMSARCLYFTLGMLADDDGFIGNPKSIMRQCGATDDDLKILLAKRYVLGFESGIIVIKHWRMNNFLRADRVKPTTYIEELSMLVLDEKGAYTEKKNACQPTDNQLTTNCQPVGIPSIGKDSIDKFSIDKNSIGKNSIDNSDDDYIKRVHESIKLDKERIIEALRDNELANKAEYLLLKCISGNDLSYVPDSAFQKWYSVAIDCLDIETKEPIYNKEGYLATVIRNDLAKYKEGLC